MGKIIFVALVLAALALAEAVYHFIRYFGERKSDELKRRLRLSAEEAGALPLLRRRRFASSAWLTDVLASFGSMERLETLLQQTDLELTVAQLLLYMVLLSAAGAALGFALRSGILAALLGMVGASTLPIMLVSARARRARRISEQLPDALEMMARAIKAGHALSASFKLVAQECPTPLAVEFARAYEQQNLGISFEGAVVAMTERVPSNLDLKLFAVSVVIQKETGGNLVEVLENIATTMRERFKFYSKLRALTAEGRLSGVILGALPFVVALAVSILNPEYVAELGHGVGRIILFSGLGLWCFGILWMRALLKVRY